jgi:hypothetical protein
MAQDRAERVARVEAAFRIANQRMSRWEERLCDGASASYFCECAEPDCREEVHLSQAQYEQVRAGTRRFVVLRDHIVEGLETEVERHDAYSIVEKPASLEPVVADTDAAAELADEIVPPAGG